MERNSTFKEKFARIKSWVPQLVKDVKKELRNDHLRRDLAFSKRYFPGKSIPKLTADELAQGYALALEEESEQAEKIGEFIANRWLLKRGDVYNFFVTRLAKINPNFTEITLLDNKDAEAIIEEGIDQFDAPSIYLFAVLNAVAFSDETLNSLGKRAEQETVKHKQAEEGSEAERSIEKLIRDHELSFSRMVDKYEKKLQGVEKKYHHDVEALKKQISRLQKQVVSGA